MALLRPKAFFDIKSRYLAARTGRKWASDELADSRYNGISMQTARSILKKATKAYSRYLHNNPAALKPLGSVNDTMANNCESQLLAALKNYRQDIHHIAISGPRSANKSDLLHHFAQRNRQYHCIPLTLATSKADSETPDNLDVDSIIKQLLPPETRKKVKLPGHSYLRVIAALTTCTAITTLGYINGALGIDQSTAVKTLMLYLPDALLTAVKKYGPLLAELSLFAVATGLVWLLFNGLRRLCNGTVNKPETPKQPQKSHYVDELAQWFMSFNRPIVIIDNLTRTGELEVLCQLNQQLNRRLKNPVRFVYVLDDELLTDRSRWFDLIIPVVPVLKRSNGVTTLNHQLSHLNIEHRQEYDDGSERAEFPDQALIDRIGDYLHDPRITTNIVNEFAVYLDQLTRELPLLDKNKLLAMMVIKNLYPREHAALTGDTGVFAQLFTNFRREKQQGLDEYRLRIDRHHEKTAPAGNTDAAQHLLPAEITSLEQLQRTERKLAGSSLAEVLEQGIMDDSFFGELTEASFGPVPWLVQNGYFAEDYRDYLSSFQPETISLDDKRLALTLTSGQSVEFTAPIDSPGAVLNQLKPTDLTQGRGLINLLVTELLNQPACHYNGYPGESFLFALFELPPPYFANLTAFIVQYQDKASNPTQKLFQNLLSINRSVLTHCVGNDYSKHSAEIIAQILMALTSDQLKTLSDDLIPAINNLENIQPLFVHSKQRPEIWQWLEENRIKFHSLSLKRCSREIAHKVIDGAMYQMNSHMLGLLLAFVREPRPKALASVSYSAICACGHKTLTTQVQENLTLLVEQTLLKQPQQPENCEEQHYLTELLNAPQLDNANKLKLLAHTGQSVTLLADIIDKSLCTQLVATNLVAPTWNNVRYLFGTGDAASSNPLPLQFITDHLQQLSRQNQSDTPYPDNLLIGLVHNKDISDSTLEKLLETFPTIAIEHFDPVMTSADRLTTILSHPNCQFSLSGLSWLARNEALYDSDSIYRYTIRFWQQYKAATDNTTHLTVGAITRLLSGDDIHVNDQLWLCDQLNNEQENDERILKAMTTLILAQPPESFSLKISGERLGRLMTATDSRDEKIRLLSMQAQNLSWPEVSTLLTELAIVPELAKDSFQFSLTDTLENNQLIEVLREANHVVAIHTTEQGEDVIKAYVKRSALPELAEITSSENRNAQ